MDTRPMLASLATLLLAACASPAPSQSTAPPQPAIEVPSTKVAEPKPEMPPIVTQTPVQEVAEVREPDAVACRVASASWSAYHLRLSESGEHFASVAKAPATVVFAATSDPQQAIAVMDDGKVLLRLVLQVKETRIFTKAVTSLGGFLIPEALKSLTWLGGSAGKLRVGVDASHVLTSPKTVEDDLACDALGITEPQFDARASVTRQKKLPARSVARDAADLSVTPAGPSVAQVGDGVAVGVLQWGGKSVRVLIEGDEYWIVGWMAATDLSTQPSNRGLIGRGYGSGAGSLGGRIVARVCKEDLDLFGELGSQRVKIGTVRAGTPMKPQVTKDPADASDAPKPAEVEFSQIALPLAKWMWLRTGARLSVRSAELQGCASERVNY